VSEQIPCTVTILDKEYRVSCEANEKADLLASAQYLDSKMKTLRDNIGVVGSDRLAVIAALNITHEMLQSQGTSQHLNNDIKNRLAALGQKIEDSLGHGDQLDL
jgi:cell division protein ZapA